MARQKEPARLSVLRARIRIDSGVWRFLAHASLFLLAVSLASAQSPTQQYVYLSLPGSPPAAPSSLIPGFSTTGPIGTLATIPGSPSSDRLEGGLVAIDGQGKFLFVLNPTTNNISMFQIDQATGAITEVPTSPFAVPPVGSNAAPSQLLSITAESSGQFLFVGYFNGSFPGNSAVASLAVNTSGSSPVLVPIDSQDIPAAPIQLLTDPKGQHLYVGLSQSPTGSANGGALALGAYFGRPSESLARRLVAEQLDDGGWNCVAPKSSRSSFHTTICVLEGLLEYERAVGSAPSCLTETAAARHRGEEYFLKRSLFRRLSTGEVANSEFLQFAFPPAITTTSSALSTTSETSPFMTMSSPTRA